MITSWNFFILLQCFFVMNYYYTSSFSLLSHGVKRMSTIPKQSTANMAMSIAGSIGKVSLVGAGPGNPDLLTIQAYKAIKSASLIVADRLISPEILKLVECELKVANKRPGCAEEAQEEIYDWVTQAALNGRDVVRLKIGDPFLFGRGGEEIIEFRKRGIRTEVLPGLSSSYSAPLAARIPLTHRDVANHVTISTGYGKESSYVDVPQYHSLGTLVLLMAIGRIKEITTTMILEKSYPPDTPVAIIENATTPKERILYGTLQTIANIAEEQGAKPPAVIVVGNVVTALEE